MTLSEKFRSVSFKGPGFNQIRLTAATIVVLHHSWWGVDDFLYRYSHAFVHAGLFAVMVFFCISGFLVTPSLVRTGDVIKFAVHRSLRIFPALIVVVLASMFLLGPAITGFPLKDYFADPQLYLYAKNITTLTVHYLPGVTRDGNPTLINGALWTLNIELWSYIVLAILCLLGALRHRAFLLVVFAVAYLLYVTPAIGPEIGAGIPQRLEVFVSLFVYFIAGANLFLFGDFIPSSGRVALGLFLIAMAALPLGIGVFFLPICLPYIAVYLGLSTLPGHNFSQRDLSYGLYLIHSPVFLAIMYALGLGTGWLLALLTMAVSLPLAYLSWTFVESPVLNMKKEAAQWAAAARRAILPKSWMIKTNVVAPTNVADVRAE